MVKRVCVAALTDKAPSFIEVYGRGNMVDMAHSKRRDLNLQGLDALDILTTKPDGALLDFNKASDRKLAKDIVIDKASTWLSCSPPCTPFCQFNHGWNFKTRPKEQV